MRFAAVCSSSAVSTRLRETSRIYAARGVGEVGVDRFFSMAPMATGAVPRTLGTSLSCFVRSTQKFMFFKFDI